MVSFCEFPWRQEVTAASIHSTISTARFPTTCSPYLMSRLLHSRRSKAHSLSIFCLESLTWTSSHEIYDVP